MNPSSSGPGSARPRLRVAFSRGVILVGGLLVAAACQPASSPEGEATRPRPPAEVAALFAAMDTADTPGCTAAASRHGETLFEGAWGTANLELGVPLEPASVFYAGSVSKQFTNAAVALLALRGALDLDDRVAEWFPELRYEQPVTIRHLIHHTSGIRDYFELMQLAGWPDRAYVSNAVSLELLTHQRELNFEPGTDYLYSNSGYMLLAELVERVDGRTLREFAQQEIFDPLGMDRSQFEDDYRTVVPGRASSYGRRDDGTWFRYLKAFDGVGSGGMLTTASDLLRWNENFHDPVVGGQQLVDLMLTRGVLADGEELAYAYGLDHGEYRGAPTVGHGGSLKGFRTTLIRFPEQRFSVAVLCNFAGARPADLAHRIADIYLADTLAPVPAGDPAAEPGDPASLTPADAGDVRAPELDAAALDRYAGRYEIRGADGEAGEITVFRDQDRLMTMSPDHRVTALAPVSEDRFRLTSGDGDLEFTRDASGTIDGLRLHGEDEIAASRHPAWEPDAAALEAYSGEYASDELRVVYRIGATDDGLVLRVGARDPDGLVPVRPHVMLSPLGILRFQRGADGEITGFRLDAGRVKDVGFERR